MIKVKSNPFSKRVDPILFLLVTCIHLIPILAVSVFPTMDGGSHVYNAHLIKELLFGDSNFIEKFHSLNFMLLPNVLGHMLLLFFQFFTDDLMAEKLLQMSYIISFAYSFRYMVRIIYPGQKIMAYYAFPLIYSFLFYLGFYNYCISLPLFMLGLGYWIRHRELNSIRQKVVMSVIFLLVFLAHIFSFVLLLFTIGIILLIEILRERKNHFSVGRISKLFLVSVPSLLLTVVYLIKFAGTGEVVFIPLKEKLECLLKGKLFVSFGLSNETPYSALLAGYIYFLFLIEIGFRIFKKNSGSNIFSTSLFLITILFLIGFIFIPEEIASGEFLTFRMLSMVTLFMLISSSWVQRLNRLGWVFILPLLILNITLLINRQPSSTHESETIMNYVKVLDNIPANSIVMPLSNSSDWFVRHFNNYAGLNKPIIILDNYEAGKKYFPVLWKPEKDPNEKIDEMFRPGGCLDISRYENFSGEKIGYILFLNERLNEKDSCSATLIQMLKEKFEINSQEGDVRVYKRR